MGKRILYRVEVPHYCCSFDVVKGRIVEAAPIMHSWVGNTLANYRLWVAGKGGRIRRLSNAQARGRATGQRYRG